MLLIGRSGLSENLNKIFSESVDARALAKSAASTFRKQGEAAVNVFNKIMDESQASFTNLDVVNTYDGGLFYGSDVHDALYQYLNDGETIELTSANDPEITHTAMEILSDAKFGIDSNVCYANALDLLGSADDEGTVSFSDLDTMNRACGVNPETMQGYSEFCTLVCDSQYSVTDKYYIIMTSMTENAITKDGTTVLVDINSNNYGLGPFLAWAGGVFIQVLKTASQLNWSTIANSVVSIVKATWSVLTAAVNAIGSYVGKILHKYVIDGEIFKANLSDSKRDYMTIPMIQYTIPGASSTNWSYAMASGSSLPSRTLWIMLRGHWGSPTSPSSDYDQLKDFIATSSIKFLVMKFCVICFHYNKTSDVLEVVIYGIPSDYTKIRDYIMTTNQTAYFLGANQPNTIAFHDYEIARIADPSPDQRALRLTMTAMNGNLNTCNRIFGQTPNDFILDLMSNTNLDVQSSLNDEEIYQGLLFSLYKVKVLLSYIANYDLIAGIASSTGSPVISTDANNAVYRIEYSGWPEFILERAVFHQRILKIHAHTIKVYSDIAAVDVLNYVSSYNNSDNDYVNEILLYSNLYNSTVDGYTFSTSNFINRLEPLNAYNDSTSVLVQSGMYAFTDGSFAFNGVSGAYSMNLDYSILPAKNRTLQDEVVALCCLFIDGTKLLLPQEVYDAISYNAPYFGNSTVTPFVNSMNKYCHPGISVLTNDEQAGRFRNVLITTGVIVGVVAIGITIGNTVVAFRSKVIRENARAESDFMTLSSLTPGTTAYNEAKARAIASSHDAARWNGFATFLGGSQASSNAVTINGLINSSADSNNIKEIIDLIKD